MCFGAIGFVGKEAYGKDKDCGTDGFQGFMICFHDLLRISYGFRNCLWVIIHLKQADCQYRVESREDERRDERIDDRWRKTD